jgi:hypothetical protein
VLSVGSCGVEPARNVGAEPCIESVFENDLAELDAAGTLAAAEANEHALITAETRRLHIAAHWADLHPGDAITQSRIPGTQHPARLGGEGTPTVADFAAAELGCVLRISDGSASRLIGDALDLRHRLPRIWAAAQAGQVPAHQARRIAAATRHLTAAQAGWVDAQLARQPPRTDLVAQPRRRLTPRRGGQPRDRYRPHNSLPEPRQRRAARPNPDREPRTPHPLPPQDQDPRQLAGPPTRTRHLALANTPPPHLRSQRHRHPPPGRFTIRTSNLARRGTSAAEIGNST